MRRIGRLVLIGGLALPGMAAAEDAYIRVEARRTAGSIAEAVSTWQQGFPNIVTYRAGPTWTAIAIGPFDEVEARGLMEQWKSEGRIPPDSLLALASQAGAVEAHGGTEASDAAAAPAEGRGSLLQSGGTSLIAGDRSSNSRVGGGQAAGGDIQIQTATDDPAVPDVAPGETAETGPYTGNANVNSFAEPDAAPPPMAALDEAAEAPAVVGGSSGPGPSLSGLPGEAAGAEVAAGEVAVVEPESPAPVNMPNGTYLRIEAVPGRIQGDAALARWRGAFPEAGMWQLPNGWFVITLGPVPTDQAGQFRDRLQQSGRIPGDTMIASSAALGAPVVAGVAPEMPDLPAEPVEMPPMAEVQDVLRWAGFYSGEVDGKTGPQTRDAIARAMAELGLSADPGAAMRELLDQRETWRAEMALETLQDAHTGLALSAPLARLQFDRSERSLSIYGPKDGSGAALILFSAPGGQQELQDLMGLVTALGWVPRPERVVERGHIALKGQNDKHIGQGEGWVRDGRADGFVLIWPVADALGQPRLAAEMRDSFARFAAPEQPAEDE